MTDLKAKKIPEVEKVTPEEEVMFTSLRANSWEDFHGQENIKASLQIAIEADIMIFAFILRAIMCDKVVFPSPGGP